MADFRASLREAAAERVETVECLLYPEMKHKMREAITAGISQGRTRVGIEYIGATPHEMKPRLVADPDFAGLDLLMTEKASGNLWISAEWKPGLFDPE